MIETDAFGTVMIILIMALLTLATRVGGMLFMSYVAIGDKTKEFMNAMSGSVLVAVIVPVAINADGPARIGLFVTGAIVLLTQKLLPAIGGGIVAVAICRQMMI